jgi:YggT family protein
MIYWIILLVYAVLSWIPDLRGGWARYLDRIVEPALAPFRRAIPPSMGIDWSFLLLLAVLWGIRALLIGPQLSRCILY